MQWQRKTFDHVVGLETQMIVTVRLLHMATGMHHIDLRRDLKARPQPGFGNQPQ